MKKAKKGKHTYADKELKEINSVIKKGNIFKALGMIIQYNEKYPKDDGGIIIYSYILRHLNRYEEALDILNSIENDINNTHISYFKEKICVLMSLKKYEEAYSIFMMIKDEWSLETSVGSIFEYKNTLCLLGKELNIDNLLDEVKNNLKDNYLGKQLLNYNIEYLYKSLNYKSKSDRYKWSFNENIDIEEMIKKVSKLIDYNKKYLSMFVDDYIIYYPNVGINENENCNYVLVSTLKDTNDIVLVNPLCDKFVLGKEICKEENTYNNGYKKKDMIKRFNDRYNRKSL